MNPTTRTRWITALEFALLDGDEELATQLATTLQISQSRQDRLAVEGNQR